METCWFYKEDRFSIPSREINSHQQTTAPHMVVTHWCSHLKHSPVSQTQARGFGGANALQCGGDLSRCPIPPEKMGDIG